MSDYTVDDSMSKIVYDLSDREIYNDIRGEIGLLKTETVIDDDVDYSWRFWKRTGSLPSPGYTMFRYFTAYLQEPIRWELINVTAQDSNRVPYFDYQATLIDTNDDKTKGVEIKNTGTSAGIISYTVRYKFLSSEAVTHEETSWETLTVRSFDGTSIKRYGRRVMPLKWPQGATKEQMQMVADAALEHYKDPYPVLHIRLRGDAAAKATQILTREISDVITVNCDNLGMSGVDHFIDAISIDDTALRSPVARWQLIGQRAVETTSYFMIDTDLIDGPKLIAGAVGWFVIDTDRIDGNKLIG